MGGRNVRKAALLWVCTVLAACGAARTGDASGGSGTSGTKPVVSSFTAVPATISAGGSSTLSWSVTGATSISIDQGIGAVTGTSRVVSPAASTLYTLTATNAAGSVTAHAAVDVTGGAFRVPVERSTKWQPGVTYNGGIPNRTTVCATLSPRGGGQDDTAQIQAALDTCPAEQVVKLSAGTFTLAPNPNGMLYLSRSNITLRGTVDANGEPVTVLNCPDGAQRGAIISLGAAWAQYGESIDLAADVAKESRTATVTRSPGFQVGELLTFDEETDDSLTWWARRCSPECVGKGEAFCEYPACRAWFIRADRPIGQVNEIAAVSGNTLTFTAPFHMPFRTAKRAQVTRIQQTKGVLPTTRAGIEDLKVSGGGGGDGGGNIHLYAASYSWVRNVEADRSVGTSINFDGTFRCELRDSYVHSTLDPNPGGGGYGIGFNGHAADNLVENSISWNFNKVMVMRASGGGNVIGYSYFEDGWGSGFPCAMESGLNASHYATSHMELFEGNRAFSFSSESTWGNSIYVTVFRNHLTARRGAFAPLDTYEYHYTDGAGRPAVLYYEDLQGRVAAAIGAHHYWQTLVGNVLGTSGQTLLSSPKTQGMDRQIWFVYEDVGQNSTQNVPMFSVGWGEGAAQEPRTVATLIRHGNFDWVTRGVVWSSDPALSHDLPPSLYLPGKPAFMGANPWPWVDPLTGQSYVLPAKARFDRIHGL